MEYNYFNTGGYINTTPAYTTEIGKLINDKHAFFRRIKINTIQTDNHTINYDNLLEHIKSSLKEGKTSIATIFKLYQTYYNPLINIKELLPDDNIFINGNNDIIFSDIIEKYIIANSNEKILYNRIKIHIYYLNIDLDGNIEIHLLENKLLKSFKQFIDNPEWKKKYDLYVINRKCDHFLKLENPFRLDRIITTTDSFSEDDLTLQEKIHLIFLKTYIWNSEFLINIRNILNYEITIQNIISIFYNELNELTLRSNIIKTMIETNTIHLFLQLLFEPHDITIDKIKSIFTPKDLNMIVYYKSSYELNELFNSNIVFNHTKVIRDYIYNIIFENNQELQKNETIVITKVEDHLQSDMPLYISSKNLKFLNHIQSPKTKVNITYDIIDGISEQYIVTNIKYFITYIYLLSILNKLNFDNDEQLNIYNPIFEILKQDFDIVFNDVLVDIDIDIDIDAPHVHPPNQPNQLNPPKPKLSKAERSALRLGDLPSTSPSPRKISVPVQNKKINQKMKDYLLLIYNNMKQLFNFENFEEKSKHVQNQIKTKFEKYKILIHFINDNLSIILNNENIINEITDKFKTMLCFESFQKKTPEKGIRMCKKNINTILEKKIMEININTKLNKNLYEIFEINKILNNSKLDSNTYIIGDQIKDNKIKNTFSSNIESINKKITKTYTECEREFFSELIELCNLINLCNNATGETYLTGTATHIVCIFIFQYINSVRLQFTNKIDLFANIFMLPKNEIQKYESTSQIDPNITKQILTRLSKYSMSSTNIDMDDATILYNVPNISQLYSPIISSTLLFKLLQEKYIKQPLYIAIPYKTIHNIPDCLETTFRNFLNALFYNNNTFNDILKIKILLPQVKDFYNKYYSDSIQKEAGENAHLEWIRIIYHIIRPLLQAKYKDANKIWHTDRKNNEFTDMRSNYLHFTLIISIILEGIDSIDDILVLLNNTSTIDNLDNILIKNLCITKITDIIKKYNNNNIPPQEISINHKPELQFIFNTYKFNIRVGHGFMTEVNINNDTFDNEQIIRYINIRYFNFYKLMNFNQVYYNENDFLLEQFKNTNTHEQNMDSINLLMSPINLDKLREFKKSIIRNECYKIMSTKKKPFLNFMNIIITYFVSFINDTDIINYILRFFSSDQQLLDTSVPYIINNKIMESLNVIDICDTFFSTINMSEYYITTLLMRVEHINSKNVYTILLLLFLNKKCIKKIYNSKSCLNNILQNIEYVDCINNPFIDDDDTQNTHFIHFYFTILFINNMCILLNDTEKKEFLEIIINIFIKNNVVFQILSYYYYYDEPRYIYNMMIQIINKIEYIENNIIKFNNIFSGSILYYLYSYITYINNDIILNSNIDFVNFDLRKKQIYDQNKTPDLLKIIFNLTKDEITEIISSRSIKKDMYDQYQKKINTFINDIILQITNPLFIFGDEKLEKKILISNLNKLFNKENLTVKNIVDLLKFIIINKSIHIYINYLSNNYPLYIYNFIGYFPTSFKQMSTYIQKKKSSKTLTLGDSLIFNLSDNEYKQYVVSYFEINDMNNIISFNKDLLDPNKNILNPNQIAYNDMNIRSTYYLTFHIKNKIFNLYLSEPLEPQIGGSYYIKYIKYKLKYLELKKNKY